MRYKISTVEKKMVIEVETYRHESGKEIMFSRLWRWGVAYSDEPIEIPADYDPEEGINIFDSFSIDDSEEDDCCIDDLIFSSEIDEKEQEALEEAYYEDGFEGLENLGFQQWDREVIYKGELQVEEV